MLQMPTQGSTQWDAFGHVMWQDSMYDGYWAGKVTALGGGRVLGIEHHRESFVGRGVLVDPARHQGLEICPDAQVIGPDLLEASLEAQGTGLRRGGILLVRTGYLAKWWTLGPDDTPDAYFLGSPGVGRDAVARLHRHEVSALVTDTIGVEPMVPEDPEDRVLPVHVACLVDLACRSGSCGTWSGSPPTAPRTGSTSSCSWRRRSSSPAAWARR